MKARRIFGEQHEVVGGGNLCNEPASERPLRLMRAPPPLPEALQRGRQAGRYEQERHGDHAGENVTHVELRRVPLA